MNIKKINTQHEKMTRENIHPLLLRLAAPSTIGMLVTALYSLADALFVSGLGTSAGAAVGVTFSVQALIQAIGYTLGTGAGSLISRNLGEKKKEEAETYASIAFWLSLLSGVTVMLIGIFGGGRLIYFLGSTDSIYPYALSYARFLFLSAPFMCAAFVVSQLLRAEGKVVWSMTGLAVGSILNILLDPLLIYTFNMGISGASLATLISQFVGLLILLFAYFFKHSQLCLFSRFDLHDLKKSGEILTNGLPSACRQGLIAAATILLNHAASIWSDASVAAISIVSRLFLFVFAFCLGIGQGMMPIVGYNYGFGQKERVRKVFRFSILLSTLVMFILSIPLIIWAPEIISLFRNDTEVIDIGSTALRAECFVFFCHGLITCTIMMLQAIGRKVSATLLAAARQGFFFLPLFFFLPSRFGIEAVIYVQPIADALTFLLAIPLSVYGIRCLRQKRKLQKNQKRYSGSISIK